MIIKTAISLSIVMLLGIFFEDAFILSIDQMIQRGDANFNFSGYRDVQIYFIGYISMALFISLSGYFYHLGSISKKIPFLAIFIGSAASIGLAELLYLIYGVFRPLQIMNYLGIEVPAAFGEYTTVTVDLIGWILTFSIDILTAILTTTWLFTIAISGQFLHKESHNSNQNGV